MASPYAPLKTRAFLRALIGMTLILFGLQIDHSFSSFVSVLVGAYLSGVAFTTMIRIWFHEQRSFEDSRRLFHEFSRATLPRQIFWLLLGVAEVDGGAGAAERDMVRRFVLERFVDAATAADLRTWEAQRIPPEQIGTLALQLRRLLTSAECETVFFWCCQITFADGRFNDHEHRILQRVARGLGLDGARARWIFHHAKADFVGGGQRRDRQGAGGGAGRATPTRSERALEVLGLEAGASEGAIRKRYRELVKRHHPDAHAHLGEVAAEEADRRFREVKAAYESLIG